MLVVCWSFHGPFVLLYQYYNNNTKGDQGMTSWWYVGLSRKVEYPKVEMLAVR